jgi:hypothetical protein
MEKCRPLPILILCGPLLRITTSTLVLIRNWNLKYAHSPTAVVQIFEVDSAYWSRRQRVLVESSECIGRDVSAYWSSGQRVLVESSARIGRVVDVDGVHTARREGNMWTIRKAWTPIPQCLNFKKPSKALPLLNNCLHRLTVMCNKNYHLVKIVYMKF